MERLRRVLRTMCSCKSKRNVKNLWIWTTFDFPRRAALGRKTEESASHHVNGNVFALILRGSAMKKWFWMPLGLKNRCPETWNIHLENFQHDIFSRAVKISRGPWNLECILRTFEIYRKMALATVLVPQVNVSLEIEKKCQKPMDLKNLRFSPKGSPRKKDGGKCFATSQWKRVCFDVARQRNQKNDFECPLA